MKKHKKTFLTTFDPTLYLIIFEISESLNFDFMGLEEGYNDGIAMNNITELNNNKYSEITWITKKNSNLVNTKLYNTN